MGDTIDIAVVGAHMRGFPLNRELTERDAIFIREARTASCYKLFALEHLTPPRPGLLRVDKGGAPIALEIWRMPAAELGGFLSGVAAPLGLGRLALEGGGEVIGFLCEAYAAVGAREITEHGGWRDWLAAAG